jgi:cell division protein FtsI (penicillin-binding protein 3)
VKKRIQLSFIFFVVLFGLVIAKASFIQIFQKEKLLSYARSQYVREIKSFPHRGNIFDRNANPLAINVQTWNVFAFPRNKGNEFKSEVKILSQFVPQLTIQSTWNKVKNRNKHTWLARKIKLSENQIVNLKKLKHIKLEPVNTRVYPNKELSSQLIGFTGLDNVGMAGVEKSLNEKLKGQAQVLRFYRDAKGRPVKYEQIHPEETLSRDVHLSIDKELQSIAENSLKTSVDYHNASRGGAAVMDAETGEILAMANYPSFDPNQIEGSRSEDRRLSFVSDPFEPGSIFKTLTVASAIENNVATATKKYFCEYGRLRVQNHIISEAESDKKFEWLTVTDILKYSSNVGTTKIAFDLKYDRLKKTMFDFGIGSKTGIELLGESSGIVNRSKKIQPLTLSNISFGHGVATTPLQMLRAYAAIANGGFLVKPTILKTSESQIIEKNRIISENTSHEVSKMLIEAVENGTGSNARIPHYQVAGKTGTAQRVSERGGYEGYVASFVGFPVNVSRSFVVLVYIDNPRQKGYYGNVAAAPVFKKITQHLLYKKKDFSKFARYDKASNTKNLDTVIVKQSASKVVIPGRMPNFVGMDKSSATRLAKSLNIELSVTGFGIVQRQNPESGETLSDSKTVHLHFGVPKYE